ncbi:GL15467 [Drosophila persimilis]|uniref:GL15467 n=1 Tax=Drosophila persimilis TaxID=7234 RepID=B4H6Q2_DROPE|nr:GL15467 [Drosophila persimilis]
MAAKQREKPPQQPQWSKSSQGHADARKSLQKFTLAWAETGMELPDRGIAGVLYEAHRLGAGVLVSVSW